MKYFLTRKNYKTHAFTLAEVLITLGVIGVVAAMTIPTLMGNIQDKENRTAFKKVYTNISQVVQQTAFENGGGIDGQYGNSENLFRNFFLPYFKSVKTCDDGDSSCWTCNGARKDDYLLNGASVTTAGMGWWYKNRPVVVLADGAMLLTSQNTTDCTGTDMSMVAPFANTLCGDFLVDVNGCKAPNAWGRDIFDIYVQKNKVFPMGPTSINNSSVACSKTASWIPGYNCAEYVIQNKDY